MNTRTLPAGDSKSSPASELAISFCIITNGKRPTALQHLISTIKNQHIPTCEIIVAGIWAPEDQQIYIPCAEAAEKGRLGLMRNLAVSAAQHELVAVLDDDMLLTAGWYRALCNTSRTFDILTSQIRLPEGGRYWDHATIGGPKGHVILGPNEKDEHTYMTGGGAWVMRRAVAHAVKWDESRQFYEGEDVDFARRCQQAGFEISHQPLMIAIHNDLTYTNVGRRVLRRKAGRTSSWAEAQCAQSSSWSIVLEANALRKAGNDAEAADLLRFGMRRYRWNLLIQYLWRQLVSDCGGSLPEAAWYPNADPLYLETLRSL